MHLNDLLQKHSISPADVLVVRHRPSEPKLRKALPWLAASRPDLYNAYQQSQFSKVEKAFTRAKFIASFVGVDAGKALFAGLYAMKSWHQLDSEGYRKMAANKELHDSFGMTGFGAAGSVTPHPAMAAIKSFENGTRKRSTSAFSSACHLTCPPRKSSLWSRLGKRAFTHANSVSTRINLRARTSPQPKNKKITGKIRQKTRIFRFCCARKVPKAHHRPSL